MSFCLPATTASTIATTRDSSVDAVQQYHAATPVLQTAERKNTQIKFDAHRHHQLQDHAGNAIDRQTLYGTICRIQREIEQRGVAINPRLCEQYLRLSSELNEAYLSLKPAHHHHASENIAFNRCLSALHLAFERTVSKALGDSAAIKRPNEISNNLNRNEASSFRLQHT